MSEIETKPSNFIKLKVEEDVKSNKYNGRVHTRFPPEPNGYLHIGHAKSICLNFGLAGDFKGGLCNLRFDDTNPIKEEEEYIKSIIEDIHWLGFDWGDRLYFASDYFDQLYEWAIQLIKAGKAYVDSMSADKIREFRGTLTMPGKDSPYRNRDIVKNLDLFQKMRNGEFEDGSHVLRAKIDMASPNLNMRDPVMYRIIHASHHRTGNKWCIYPMYDWAHGQSDSIEGITHSICTLEFEDHRPLYDWFLDALGIYKPEQIEFARLNLNYTVMSKRKFVQLIQEHKVDGWDDPRMPTLSGLRRRGYTPNSIRVFADKIGVAKSDNMVDIALLEHCLREDLNRSALRVMAVLNPLKVIITNYPEEEEKLEAVNNPEDASAGTRLITFTREIYIEREDFREDPPRKFFRLAPGTEVRLKHAYYITCEKVIKDTKTGVIKELHCTYDPKSRGGWTDDGRKIKGTLHWVSAKYAVNAEVRLYENLFLRENPDDTKEGEDFYSYLNPESLKVLKECKVEPYLVHASTKNRYQFLRQGYFTVDSKDSLPNALVFNRTVSLRDSWARIERSQNSIKE
jgi:glutaminyl-tRNA synthetase